MPDQINLHVVSRPTEIERKTGQQPPGDRLNYLPWGTRSLKLAVEGSYKGQLNISPTRRSTKPGQILGYAGGSKGEAVQVSWGGGWEEGFSLDYEPGVPTFAFFNLSHAGPTAESYALDLIARDKYGDELGSLSIELQPPPLPVSQLSRQWRQAGPGAQEMLLNPQTDASPPHVPFYMSRWWPEAWVGYADPAVVGAPPRVRLLCQRDVGKGYSRVDVYAAPANGGAEVHLAYIDGDIQFPLVDLRQISADLYHIAGNWALRVWFFWLDKDVSTHLQQAEINPGSLDSDQQAVLERWANEQEIPDAERVDLVFDSQMQIKFLCTDLHWHELWAPFNGKQPLRVSIAGERMRDVTLRGAQGLYVVAAARAQNYLPKPGREFDPSQEVIERLRDPSRTEKGPGSTAHKHTPYFHGVEFDAGLTSSDVLKG